MALSLGIHGLGVSWKVYLKTSSFGGSLSGDTRTGSLLKSFCENLKFWWLSLYKAEVGSEVCSLSSGPAGLPVYLSIGSNNTIDTQAEGKTAACPIGLKIKSLGI